MKCPVCFEKLSSKKEGDVLFLKCEFCGYLNKRRIA